MKPDAVLLNDMDEVEVAPSEMFSRLGMLVVESRVPHPSAKGRTEGPHCPSSPGDPPHHACTPHHTHPLCKRAEALQHQMHVLWKNHIPMCIEVLLYEDCAHGEEKARTLDVTMPSSTDNYILLEQWTVQIVPRRGMDGQIRPRELFQAIKSYLHFSQLSAWLNLTQGKAPRNVGYRISPPGEFCISSFRETPQWHTFPVCTLANNAGVKVTMGCLPRRHDNQLLLVPCHKLHHVVVAPSAPPGPLDQGTADAHDLRATGSHVGAGAVGSASRSRLSPLMVKPPPDGAGAGGAGFRDVPQFVSPQRPHASMVPPKQQQQQQRHVQQQQQPMQMQGNRVLSPQQQPSFKAMPSSTNHPSEYTPGKWPAEPRNRYDKRRSIQEVVSRGESHYHSNHHQLPSPNVPSEPTMQQQQQQHPHNLMRFSRSKELPVETTSLQQQQQHHKQHKQHTLQDAYQMQKDFETTTLEAISAQEAAVGVVAATTTAAAAATTAFTSGDQKPTATGLTTAEEQQLNMQKQTGAIPKKKFGQDASPALPLEPHSAPDFDLFNANFGAYNTTSKSPKVLFSRKSHGQGYYHRDEGKWFMSSSTYSSDSPDSDQSSPEIDKYLKNMKTKADPLSPEEIQNYLASLSIRNHRKRQPSPLAKTPSPEFIDTNSQAVKDLTNIFSSFGEEELERKTDSKLQCKASGDASSAVIPHTAKIQSRKTDAKSPPPEVTSSRRRSEHTEDDEVQSQYKLVKQSKQLQSKRSPSPKRISSSKSQQVLHRHRVPQQQSSEKQPQHQHQSSQTPTAPQRTEAREETVKLYRNRSNRVKSNSEGEAGQDKVLFRLGDDDENVEDEKSKEKKSKSAEYTNGVSSKAEVDNGHLESRSDVTNGCHVTNGHSAITAPEVDDDEDDDVMVTSSVRHEDVATSPRQGSLKRSVSDSEALRRHLVDASVLPGINKASPLYKTLMMREMSNINHNKQNDALTSRPIPTSQESASFRRSLENSSSMIFHASTGLPLQSSPAPMKKRPSDSFDYDRSLNNPRSIKNSLSCVNLDERNKNEEDGESRDGRFYSTSAPASTNCLLGNFEESLLNGRIEPSGVVEGFTAEVGASGNFCPKHVTLPVTAFFFNLSDDNAPSPYLGHVNLEMLGKRGYHIPRKGTVQVTLFNPNKTVVKMFVVVYDLTDMPAQCQTFLRQRTLYMPVSTARHAKPEDVPQPVYLRYLIHLRFQSSKSGKIYLHTDMRMIFARDKFEYDSRVANYELRSFTEAPTNPKFSPKR